MFSGGFEKMAYYQKPVQIEKSAGYWNVLKNKVSHIFKPYETLYHGTTQLGKRRILKQGLIPQGGVGATSGSVLPWKHGNRNKDLQKANKNLVFLTRDIDEAMAAAQSVQRAASNNRYASHQGKMHKLFKKEPQKYSERYLKTRNAGAVLEVRIPKAQLKQVRNPEVGFAKGLKDKLKYLLHIAHEGPVDKANIKYLGHTEFQWDQKKSKPAVALVPDNRKKGK